MLWYKDTWCSVSQYQRLSFTSNQFLIHLLIHPFFLVYSIQVFYISSTILYVKLAYLMLNPYAFNCNSNSAFLITFYTIKTCACTLCQFRTRVYTNTNPDSCLDNLILNFSFQKSNLYIYICIKLVETSLYSLYIAFYMSD